MTGEGGGAAGSVTVLALLAGPQEGRGEVSADPAVVGSGGSVPRVGVWLLHPHSL